MIKHLILDFDGIFNLDDYSAVSKALAESSGLPENEIEEKIGNYERRYVLTIDTGDNFLKEVAKGFNFKGSGDELVALLNDRGDSGLFEEVHKFKDAGLALSILSNQIAYRLPFVREQLKTRTSKIGGITGFERVYFSPELGLQKPFVGVSEGDKKSAMDTSGVNIFPYAASDMQKLGYNVKECLFIDDSKKNVASAEASGFEAEHVKFDINQPQRTVYKQIKKVLDSYNIS